MTHRGIKDKFRGENQNKEEENLTINTSHKEVNHNLESNKGLVYLPGVLVMSSLTKREAQAISWLWEKRDVAIGC